MTNPVMRWQILTRQPKKLEEFYSALFGWRISGDNPLGYMTVNTNSAEGIHGGLWPISEQEGHSLVQLFIRVDDVKGQVKKAEQLGARIVIPAQVLPGGDEMAILVDPDGITFGIFAESKS
jgi:predicted enzyme related to lactoylglutathione lyase